MNIKNVTYDSDAHTVTITLAKPYRGALQVTVHAGVMAANGTSSSRNVSMIANQSGR